MIARSDKEVCTAMEPEEQSALLDVTQVAKLLKCSPRTVYRLRDGDRMPRPVNLGALVRWRRVDIENWIADGCRAIRRIGGGR